MTPHAGTSAVVVFLAGDRAGLPAQAGLGFKPQHFDAILADGPGRTAFVEVHGETAWAPVNCRTRNCTDCTSACRCRSMASGCRLAPRSAPGDEAHLDRLATLLGATGHPESFSPSTWPGPRTTAAFYNDLLPLRYNDISLAHVCDHVNEVQDTLRMRMLLENPSTYVAFGRKLDGRDRVSARSRAAHRLRPVARRQQCPCVGGQPRLRCRGHYRRVPDPPMSGNSIWRGSPRTGTAAARGF